MGHNSGYKPGYNPGFNPRLRPELLERINSVLNRGLVKNAQKCISGWEKAISEANPGFRPVL